MPGVARVHYEIPDDLHRKAKAAAAMRGVTLREFIVQALRDAVAKAERPDSAAPHNGA
jgi:predicted HicB family RNase H-like nuclease